MKKVAFCKLKTSLSRNFCLQFTNISGILSSAFLSVRINFIHSNGHSVLSEDPKTIGNTLDKYFSSIGHQLATDIPEANTTISDYLDPPLQNSIYFDPIIPQEIETEISLLPYNKALGLYSTPVKVLKLAKSVKSIPLTEISNQSVLTGVYPAKLKYAKVIPV